MKYRLAGAFTLLVVMSAGIFINISHAEEGVLLPDGNYKVTWSVAWRESNSVTGSSGPGQTSSSGSSRTADYSGEARVAYRNSDQSTKTLEVANTHSSYTQTSEQHETRTKISSTTCDMQFDRYAKDTIVNPDTYLGTSTNYQMFRLQPFKTADGRLQMHWPMTQFPGNTNPANNGADPRPITMKQTVKTINGNRLCGNTTESNTENIRTNPFLNPWIAIMPLFTVTEDPSRPGQRVVLGDLQADVERKVFTYDHTFQDFCHGSCPDSISVEVHMRLEPEITNEAPEVNAGEDTEAIIGKQFTLSGIVKDDGLPNPPAQVTATWTAVSGPEGGSVSFNDQTALSTKASFSKPGVYTLELTASDGEKQASDTVVVTVIGKPNAEFSSIIYSGGKVEFDAANSKPYASTVAIVRYDWTFDDGKTEATNNKLISHLYDYRDPLQPIKKYKVKLVVTDSEGNVSEPVEHEIDVCSPDELPGNAYEYTGLVRCVEDALHQSPRDTLSTMRKLYYGFGTDWSFMNRNGWQHIIPCGMNVPDPRPQLSKKLYDALIQSKVKNTVLEGDMSHVFTTLEAMECPAGPVTFSAPTEDDNLAQNFWTVNMPNYFAAGWGGDLASAAGKKAADAIAGNEKEWPYYLGPDGTRSGYDDLSGDMNGLVMGFYIQGKPCSTSVSAPVLLAPLSQYLYEYFPDPSNPLEPRPHYQSRQQCAIDVLDVRQPDRLPDKARANARLTQMVYEFALPYTCRDLEGSCPRVLEPTARYLIHDYSAQSVDIFVDWLLNNY
jgi:hypothetical protein